MDKVNNKLLQLLSLLNTNVGYLEPKRLRDFITQVCNIWTSLNRRFFFIISKFIFLLSVCADLKFHQSLVINFGKCKKKLAVLTLFELPLNKPIIYKLIRSLLAILIIRHLGCFNMIMNICRRIPWGSNRLIIMFRS